MAVAAVAFYRWPWRPDAFSLASMAAAALLLLSPWVVHRLLRIAGLMLLGLFFGFAASSLELATTRTTIFSGEATVRIAGTVIGREVDDRGRYRYMIDVEGTDRPVLSRPPERARILVSSRHDPLPIGSHYKGLVRLRPPAGPAYPGAHDFAFGAFFDGIGAYGFSLGAPEAPGPARPPTFGDRIARLRLSMGDKIRDALPGPTGAVASALITGERAGIPDEINENLRITGLAHVLSISGFHMALVAGFFMLATRIVLAAVASLALRWPSKKIAAVVALAATGFYFLLAGDNPATERSFVMIAVMLGAVLLDRPALTLRNVSLAAIVVIGLSPHVVLTATFQMSFAATAALVGAYGTYARWRAQRNDTARGWLHPRTIGLLLVGTLLSSLIAGAATAPFAIHHFQRGAPFSLVANVIATPLFSFWIMPLAMLSVLAMPLGLEAGPLAAMGWNLDLVFPTRRPFRRRSSRLSHGTDERNGAHPLLGGHPDPVVLRQRLSLGRGLAGLPRAGRPPARAPAGTARLRKRQRSRIDRRGATLRALRPRPTAFVWDQWHRAYPNGPASPRPAGTSRTSAPARNDLAAARRLRLPGRDLPSDDAHRHPGRMDRRLRETG